jgi:hypothetical protein
MCLALSGCADCGFSMVPINLEINENTLQVDGVMVNFKCDEVLE